MKKSASKIKHACGCTAENLLARFQDHLKYIRARHPAGATDFDKLASLSLAIRDLAVERMLATRRTYADGDVKRVSYLSMEFLIGRLLSNNVIALGLRPVVEEALHRLGLDFERLCNFEPDAGEQRKIGMTSTPTPKLTLQKIFPLAWHREPAPKKSFCCGSCVFRFASMPNRWPSQTLNQRNRHTRSEEADQTAGLRAAPPSSRHFDRTQRLASRLARIDRTSSQKFVVARRNLFS